MGLAMSSLRPLVILAALVALPSFAGPSQAAETMRQIGEREFTHYCAGCHGAGGEGGGPIAEYFGVTPPPLTRLAAENGGKFPLERVFQTIDGRRVVRAHGSEEMQIWGLRYRSEVDDIMIDAPQALQDDLRARLVRGRILEVVYYLLTIQED